MFKIKITLTLVVLLALAMGLVNLVLIMLWQRQGMHQEIRQAGIMVDLALGQERPRMDGTFERLVSGGQADCAGYRLDGGDESVFGASWCEGGVLLHSLEVAATSGREVIRTVSPLQGLLRGDRPVLVLARPIPGDTSGGAIGVVLALDELSAALGRAERVILVYMGVNLLIFGTVGFFRIRNDILRPVERLARLADRYEDNETRFFAEQGGTSEFFRLATSLSSMLARIERDRAALKESVRELGLANRRLMEKQQEMIRAEKLASVGRLAAGLAHEIGNPLGIVQGYLGLLQQAEAMGREEKEYLRRAEKELERVTRLIRQLLDFARVSKGERQEVSVNELLATERAMVRDLPLFHGMTLDCHLDAERDRVVADPGQLRQVFLNCLVNAADAVAAKGETDPSGHIVLRTENRSLSSGDDEREVVLITIEDNGVGLAPGLLDTVFDPFFTTKEPGKGTGLGLAVSLAIVEAAEGAMRLLSRKGGGVTVEIELPVVRKQTADMEPRGQDS
ncbi:sensor histidine kinase [Desulfolithobacter sp.]